MSKVDQWINRQRGGLPLITPRMMNVLRQLRDAKNADQPFIALPEVHGRTLGALIRRDWVFRSEGLDGIRYKITGRGLRALSVYEQPIRRYDGICPTCGIRPKLMLPSGQKYGYCRECDNQSKRRAYQLGRTKSNTLCSQCHERPRHRYPSGRFNTYCIECKRERAIEERRLKQERLRALLLAGEFLKCGRKDCDQPRHYTDNTIFDWCEDHQREYMNAYNLKRRTKALSTIRRTRKDEPHARS